MNPIEQIKNRLSILDVVSTYIRVEKSGNQFKARCPFHNEKTASFYISPEYNTFHCFGCGKAGDIFTFIQEIEHIPFRESLELLGEKAGVSVKQNNVDKSQDNSLLSILDLAETFYVSELLKNPSALQYLEERGVSRESIDSFKIGYAPAEWRALTLFLTNKGVLLEDAKNAGLIIQTEKGYYDRWRGRIMFPIKTSANKTVGFSGRILPEIEKQSTTAVAKYVNSPETPVFHKSKILFGLEKAKNHIYEAQNVIVVEGQLDTVLSHQIHIKNVIGVSGTALTDEQLRLLKRYTSSITFSFDGDKAGRDALVRSSKSALALDYEVNVLPLQGKDPADMILSDPNSWLKLVHNRIPLFTYLIEQIKVKDIDRVALSKEIHNSVFQILQYHTSSLTQDLILEDIAKRLELDVNSLKNDFETFKKRQQVTTEDTKSEKKESENKNTIEPLYQLYVELLAQIHHLDDKSSHEQDIQILLQTYASMLPNKESIDATEFSKYSFESEYLKSDQTLLNTTVNKNKVRFEIQLIENEIQKSKQLENISNSDDSLLKKQFNLAKKRDSLKQTL